MSPYSEEVALCVNCRQDFHVWELILQGAGLVLELRISFDVCFFSPILRPVVCEDILFIRSHLSIYVSVCYGYVPICLLCMCLHGPSTCPFGYCKYMWRPGDTVNVFVRLLFYLALWDSLLLNQQFIN